MSELELVRELEALTARHERTLAVLHGLVELCRAIGAHDPIDWYNNRCHYCREASTGRESRHRTDCDFHRLRIALREIEGV